MRVPDSEAVAGCDDDKRSSGSWEEAEAMGFDVSLLDANLRLTPRQRIRQHALALETALRLRVAMKAKRARSGISS